MSIRIFVLFLLLSFATTNGQELTLTRNDFSLANKPSKTDDENHRRESKFHSQIYIPTKTVDSEACNNLNSSRNVWIISDEILGEYDLQTIIDCSSEGDILSLESTRTIKPHQKISVNHSLTIRGPIKSEAGANLTCPTRESLFLFE